MKALTRRHPFGHVDHGKRFFDRFFDDSLFRPYRVRTLTLEDNRVTLDMYQTEDEMVVKASLPGLTTEDVDISIENNVLTIRGEADESTEEKQGDYILRERHSGSYSRSVRLPKNLTTAKTEATFEDGVLTVTIPKSEDAKPETIKVKAVKKNGGEEA